MFIDEAKIYLCAGDGGDGCVSFRREKYVPRGGPNGGDGGKGGDVILRASSDLSTLLDLKYQQRYVVPRAEHGQGKNRHGKNSPDLRISVPIGTVVRNPESGEILADLTFEDQEVTLARGGRGGRGNAQFATPTRRAPTIAEKGEKGDERSVLLELKLIADVGLVGLPNAGKSTLISRVSSARPKIADYPFTTLTPHLGVVSADKGRTFTVADIPGIIEGAHLGKGLGLQFLRHIERTALLLLLIDVSVGTDEDPRETLAVLSSELEAYHPALMQKPRALCATKIDAVDPSKRERLSALARKQRLPLFFISSVTGAGIAGLIRWLWEKVDRQRRAAAKEASG